MEAAAQSTHLLVTATDGDGLTQLLVPVSAPGLGVTAMQTVDLTKRFGAVTFTDVVVGADALVGEPGAAEAAVERQFLQAVSILNAETVGCMQTAFDMTVEWGFDRYTFGRPLASYQAIKHRFADMLTWLEASHAISDAACAAVAAAAPNAFELSSAAKAYVGQYGGDLVQDCVQIHGGIGVTFEHDLHLYLRRLTVDRSLFGRRPSIGAWWRCITSRTWRWRHERAARRGARGVGRAGGPGQLPGAGPQLDTDQPAPGHARGVALGPPAP